MDSALDPALHGRKGNCRRNRVPRRDGPAGVRLRRLLPQSYLHNHKFVVECALFHHKLPRDNVHGLHGETHLAHESQKPLHSNYSLNSSGGFQISHNLLPTERWTMGGYIDDGFFHGFYNSRSDSSLAVSRTPYVLASTISLLLLDSSTTVSAATVGL